MSTFETSRVYHSVISDIKRVNLLRGGTRSTKSFSLTQLAVRWLIYGKIGNLEIPEGDFFILRESFPALRRTVLKDFMTILSREGLMQYVNHVKTTNEFKRKGRTISFFSADDESKIHGPQNTIFWINEATSVNESVFNNLIWRCKEFCFLDYNPLNPESWVKKLEDERMPERGDVSLDISTVHDNKFLSQAQMDEIMAIKDKDLREVYLKGNWASLSGLIFPDWTLVDCLPAVYEKRYFGIDFGWIDPTVIVECVQIGSDVYINEVAYKSQMTLDEMADICIKELAGVRGVGDSASPLHIAHLQKSMVKIRPAKKGPDSLLKGINMVKLHNIHITKDSVNVIKDFKSYKWQKDPEGRLIDSKPVDYMNHGPDAVMYAISHFGRRTGIKFV